MYRYLFVLTAETGRMRAALVSRGYRPRHALHAGAMGRVATAMFLRTYGRGERVHLAMLARGYRGAMPQLAPLSLRRADLAFVAAVCLASCPCGCGGAVSCAIHARELAYRYPGGHTRCAAIDLHVEHGERVALLGPNGAGKTTFMHHLNGLITGQGQLEVAGLTVGRDTLHHVRARVGLVFQDPDDQLFMPTVARTSPSARSTRASSAATSGARDRRARRRAHDPRRRPRAHQLSMGERRRVAIATVLAMHPSLLVLDEPSANLDPRARRDLLDILDASSTPCSSPPTTSRWPPSSASAPSSSPPAASSPTGPATDPATTTQLLAPTTSSSPTASTSTASRSGRGQGPVRGLPSARPRPRAAAGPAQLRSPGRRVTRQRALIWEALTAEPDRHLSAQEVVARVRDELPRVNPSTVYRTLDLLVADGLVLRTDLGADRVFYEPAHDHRHHHLVCRALRRRRARPRRGRRGRADAAGGGQRLRAGRRGGHLLRPLPGLPRGGHRLTTQRLRLAAPRAAGDQVFAAV